MLPDCLTCLLDVLFGWSSPAATGGILGRTLGRASQDRKISHETYASRCTASRCSTGARRSHVAAEASAASRGQVGEAPERQASRPPCVCHFRHVREHRLHRTFSGCVPPLVGLRPLSLLRVSRGKQQLLESRRAVSSALWTRSPLSPSRSLRQCL